ncbi:hypothetical protein RGQ29_014530 [Quercus rubra]|uniref:DUF659 domain-containing protein n=1 Tax=Quercus rubra TaxID=3512 RepID=A0AAN7FM13_QUERU|nr:hypothetical protein RGQ29_014530 [Quercus rubra]
MVVGHQWQAINGNSLSSQTHAASSLQKPFFTPQVSKTQASQSKHQLYIWALNTITKVIEPGSDRTVGPENPRTVQIHGWFKVRNRSMRKKHGTVRTAVRPSGSVNCDRLNLSLAPSHLILSPSRRRTVAAHPLSLAPSHFALHSSVTLSSHFAAQPLSRVAVAAQPRSQLPRRRRSSAQIKMETETGSTPSHEVDSNVMESSSRVREKVDPAWEHFSLGADEKGRNTFTCDIGSCKKVSHDVRYQMLEYVKEFELKKKAEKQRQEEMFSVPSTNSDMQEDDDVQEVFSSGHGLPKKTVLGKRKSTNPVDSYFAPRTTPGAQPGLKSVFQSKERVRQADMAIARFLYDNCIPFNVVNSVYYQKMIDAIAAAGPGYKGPSYHAVRVPLLRDQKKEVQLLVESQRRHWAEVGCTLMADGWTDTRHRSLINFLVYCPRGMVFVKSVDASDIVKSTRNLFKLFDEVVTWVGPKNIVHMVTNNASNYVSAGKLLCEKYKTISWSPCAAHCLNLVLQDMGDMPHVERLKKRASQVTVFIYNHVALIAWLRKRPGWTDIVRVGATRFATTFLSFGSLHVHKHDLQALVISK